MEIYFLLLWRLEVQDLGASLVNFMKILFLVPDCWFLFKPHMAEHSDDFALWAVLV